MCVRAYGLIQKTYNPDRVRAPLKRTNPKDGLEIGDLQDIVGGQHGLILPGDSAFQAFSKFQGVAL